MVAEWMRCLIGICTIAYGGYVDYKKREIPNLVPILLLLLGLFSGESLWRVLYMILALLALLLAEVITKQEIPGGDLKLICSMAFAFGPFETLLVLLMAGLGSIVVGIVKKQPWKRHIPLCSYVAPAFMLLGVAKLI